MLNQGVSGIELTPFQSGTGDPERFPISITSMLLRFTIVVNAIKIQRPL